MTRQALLMKAQQAGRSPSDPSEPRRNWLQASCSSSRSAKAAIAAPRWSSSATDLSSSPAQTAGVADRSSPDPQEAG